MSSTIVGFGSDSLDTSSISISVTAAGCWLGGEIDHAARLCDPAAASGFRLSALRMLEILVPCSFFLILIAVIKFLYDFLWLPLHIHHILNSHGIKEPHFRFIHGNNKEVIKMKKEALSKPMGLTHDIFPQVQPHLYSWTNRFGKIHACCFKLGLGKNYLHWNGVRAQLVISEPELVKQVLKNSEKAYPKQKPSIYVSKLVGNELLLVEGEKWVRQRKLADNVFHGESLKNMIPGVIASVETMLEKWKGQENKEIEVFGEFRLLTSLVISRTACNYP